MGPSPPQSSEPSAGGSWVPRQHRARTGCPLRPASSSSAATEALGVDAGVAAEEERSRASSISRLREEPVKEEEEEEEEEAAAAASGPM